MTDFHTHTVHSGRRELVSAPERPAGAAYWSLELHPWRLRAVPGDLRARLTAADALGEVGFDKLHGAAKWPEEQLTLLRELLTAAAELGKPAVLHAVGPLPELYRAVAGFPRLRLLLHGFARPRPDLLGELLDRGFYVSLHRRLALHPGICAELRRRNFVRVGLESDDACDCDLAELYRRAGGEEFVRAADAAFEEFLHR